MEINVDDITIEDRLRDDFGDLQGLANSIDLLGLLHPIVVDNENRLIAGHRRLKAVKMLGWSDIPVKVINNLSENERRLIELEENTKRKDLTDYEQSKNLNELVVVTKEVLKESDSPPSSKKKSNAEKPDSEKKVSEKLGVPQQTINEAKQHVKAVEINPNLKHLPKKDAIKTAKNPSKIELINAAYEEFPELKDKKMSSVDVINTAEKLRTISAEDRPEFAEKSENEIKKIKKVAHIISSASRLKREVTKKEIDQWLTNNDYAQIKSAIDDLDLAIDEMSYLRTELEKHLKSYPKKVKPTQPRK